MVYGDMYLYVYLYEHLSLVVGKLAFISRERENLDELAQTLGLS